MKETSYKMLPLATLVCAMLVCVSALFIERYFSFIPIDPLTVLIGAVYSTASVMLYYALAARIFDRTASGAIKISLILAGKGVLFVSLVYLLLRQSMVSLFSGVGGMLLSLVGGAVLVGVAEQRRSSQENSC